MKKFILITILIILLFGCIGQVANSNNTSAPNITIPNVTVEVNNETLVEVNNETLNITPPIIPDEKTNSETNSLTNETLSQYATYDLSIKDIAFNVSPILSFHTKLSVKVTYEGQSKPSRYKVTYYDNEMLRESKIVNSPGPEETVVFFWLPFSDGKHVIKVVVESLDEVNLEDGPKSNNEFEKNLDVAPISFTSEETGKEISARYYRAQQFIVQNKIGIGSIAVYLKANERVDDVQMGLELRRDDFNKPGKVIRTSWLAAKDLWVGSPQWVTISYGVNGVYLEPGKYWIALYLAEDSVNKPVWIGASVDSYEGKSAILDKEEGYGNIWREDSGDFTFKVSTAK